MAEIDRIQRMKAEIRASEGWQLRRSLAGLGRSYGVFLGNDRELRTYFRSQSELPAVLELWSIHNRAGFERFLDEVDRLLHNYLAAAGTLRDHGRNVWRDHAPADKGFRDEHTRLIDSSFASSDVAQFVQRLRNYALHTRLPIARGQLRGTSGSFESRIILPRDELARWSDWGEGASRYLAAAPEDIELLEVVDEYTQAVRSFNDWFAQAFVRGHQQAFDELARLEQNLADAYKTG